MNIIELTLSYLYKQLNINNNKHLNIANCTQVPTVFNKKLYVMICS